ncbi:unnamed protein product [Sphagnum tenellum]
MGNQKKSHKRAEREGGKGRRGSDLSKIPDSYETSQPETVIAADHLDAGVRAAISVYWEPESHADKNIRQLPNDLRAWPPGERGVGVRIDDAKLSPEQREQRAEMYQRHAFEEYVSELISYNRSLPDWRGDWCRANYPPDRGLDLDPTSVVICFHNEAWSTLVRTVHSIVNRSPDHLLEEILLIDDNSDMEHLGARLDEYMEQFPKVRIIHKKERMGLIRCRMFGSMEAKAKVLTFLDSHIEAGIGWLEPLLYRVKEEPKLIISPVIDAINDTTFWYTFIERDLKGLFNWNMRFEWQQITDEERKRKPNIWAPHVNPVMSGGLFTINKDWFEHIGFYDTGMEVWGGENFEVSFKAWMCGGRIEIAPCSRVGHVFRTWSPYKVDVKKNVAYNNIRVAQVWMDEFKFLYFDRKENYQNETYFSFPFQTRQLRQASRRAPGRLRPGHREARRPPRVPGLQVVQVVPRQGGAQGAALPRAHRRRRDPQRPHGLLPGPERPDRADGPARVRHPLPRGGRQPVLVAQRQLLPDARLPVRWRAAGRAERGRDELRGRQAVAVRQEQEAAGAERQVHDGRLGQQHLHGAGLPVPGRQQDAGVGLQQVQLQGAHVRGPGGREAAQGVNGVACFVKGSDDAAAVLVGV